MCKSAPPWCSAHLPLTLIFCSICPLHYAFSVSETSSPLTLILCVWTLVNVLFFDNRQTRIIYLLSINSFPELFIQKVLLLLTNCLLHQFCQKSCLVAPETCLNFYYFLEILSLLKLLCHWEKLVLRSCYHLVLVVLILRKPWIRTSDWLILAFDGSFSLNDLSQGLFFHLFAFYFLYLKI